MKHACDVFGCDAVTTVIRLAASIAFAVSHYCSVTKLTICRRATIAAFSDTLSRLYVSDYIGESAQLI